MNGKLLVKMGSLLRRSLRWISAIALVPLTIVLLLGPLNFAQAIAGPIPKYAITDLGTLAPANNGDKTESLAYAINNHDEVVGASLEYTGGGVAGRAFRW